MNHFRSITRWVLHWWHAAHTPAVNLTLLSRSAGLTLKSRSAGLALHSRSAALTLQDGDR